MASGGGCRGRVRGARGGGAGEAGSLLHGFDMSGEVWLRTYICPSLTETAPACNMHCLHITGTQDRESSISMLPPFPLYMFSAEGVFTTSGCSMI